MADPFIGEIRIFGFGYAPRNWAMCDGQLMPISENTALFSIISTIYGGDGRSNMGLPNLQSRAPVHMGRGPGLSSYTIGQMGGVTEVALDQTKMPSHSHEMRLKNAQGSGPTPSAATTVGTLKGKKKNKNIYASPMPASPVPMNDAALSTAGSSTPHYNMQPYLVSNFCICLIGVYPSRN